MMKRILVFVLLLSLFTATAWAESENAPEIPIVPAEWNSPASQQGRVETFEYTSGNDTKTAYVYLPFGYDDSQDTQYNILYFMHGGGGWAGQFYNRSYALNDILDHAIESGEIAPLIVVTPSFYPSNDSDSSVSNAAGLVSIFHEEFLYDLMPAVETHYRTYAADGDSANLEASRDHRAFGGFSMGSVTTWYQFLNALDDVRYFLPFSGDCWALGQMGGRDQSEKTAAYLAEYAAGHKYRDDFYIYAMTGSADIAYEMMESQINAMEKQDVFQLGASPAEGNLSFGVLDGGTHDYTWYRNYIYSALKAIWPGEREVKIRVEFADGTTGFITDLRDNAATASFLELLPFTATLRDWDGREYYIPYNLTDDPAASTTEYAPGEFTWWRGGWITAYYDTNDDHVIEAGSIVLGIMDQTMTDYFHTLNGRSMEATFTAEE